MSGRLHTQRNSHEAAGHKALCDYGFVLMNLGRGREHAVKGTREIYMSLKRHTGREYKTQYERSENRASHVGRWIEKTGRRDGINVFSTSERV